MQLRERIILNTEMMDINSNFDSAIEASLLELEQLGMSCVLHNEKVKAISTPIIRTRFARSTKTYTTFYLMPKCCLFQYVFFWLVDYVLECSIF